MKNSDTKESNRNAVYIIATSINSHIDHSTEIYNKYIPPENVLRYGPFSKKFGRHGKQQNAVYIIATSIHSHIEHNTDIYSTDILRYICRVNKFGRQGKYLFVLKW